MVKKIFFQIVFFNFFFIGKVFTAEGGGMPQLNPEFWISQIFWLTITFGVLYLVLSKLILPKISANLELRRSQILDNIEAADRQRKESESKLNEYDEIIFKSKNDAKSIYNQAREKASKDIIAKRIVLENQIDEEVKKAEEEINKLRLEAPAKINKIAIETSFELIQKLIGAEVNNSSISAIVDDLLRKNGDKYYGN